MNTELVTMLSAVAIVAQSAELCNGFAGSRVVQFQTEGSRVAYFSSGLGWVLKCIILAPEKFAFIQYIDSLRNGLALS